jgi:hypothetical protein
MRSHRPLQTLLVVHSINRPTSYRHDINGPHLPVIIYHTFYHDFSSELLCQDYGKPFRDYATSSIRKHEQLLIYFPYIRTLDFQLYVAHSIVDIVYDLLHTIIRFSTTLLRPRIIG